MLQVVFECSFYLTTFHLHGLLLNISRRVSAFLFEKKDLESIREWIYISGVSFKISSPTFLNTRGLVFLRLNQGSGVKMAEFPRDATLRVAHFEWPRFLFLHFLAVFLPETGQQCCKLLPNAPRKLFQVITLFFHTAYSRYM